MTQGGPISDHKTVIGGVTIDHEFYRTSFRDHFQNKVVPIHDDDKEMWEKLTNVPKVSKPLAFGCAFLNLLLPGSGTMTAACSASDNVSKVQMAIAILQFLTTLFLIGWVFSIYWSYLLINKAMEPEGGPAGMRYSGERH